MVFLRINPIIAQVFTRIKAQFEALLVKYNFDSFKNLDNKLSFWGEFFSISCLKGQIEFW